MASSKLKLRQERSLSKEEDPVSRADPHGLPDWTIPTAITAQLIDLLKVDIAAQTVAELKVDITAQTVPTLGIDIKAQSVGNLNVNLAASAISLDVKTAPGEKVEVGIVSSIQLNVNIAASAVTLNIHEVGTANVAITSSIQLNVNLAASAITLNVHEAGTANVAITSSIQLNVNLAASAISLDVKTAPGEHVDTDIVSSVQLNVNIAASAITLNVHEAGTANVAITSSIQLNVNLAASAITLNVHEAGTANVAITSAITLNMNIASSAINVPVTNPTGENLNVAIQSSTTLNINIGGATINVPVTNPTGQNLNVAVQSSVTLNVNIASSAVTLNVAIQSSAATLNVSIRSSAVPLKTGQVSTALAFDGVDDSVTIPDSDSLDVGNAGSIAFWIKYATVSSADWYDTVSKAAYVSPGYCVIVRKDGARADITLDSVCYDYTDAIPSDTWCHIVFVWTSTGVKYYRDGVLKGTISGTVTCTANTNSVKIGERNNGYLGIYDLLGSLYDVRIYNRALSDSDVASLYNNPHSGPTQGLVLWLPFNEGTGTSVRDKSGLGNNGTISGAKWVSAEGSVPATVNVNITAQAVGNLNVNIAAQSVGNIGIDIKAQTLGQLNVNIAASAVSINVKTAATEHVDTDIVSSIQLNVNIAASAVTLNVNISSITAGVVFNVAQSGTWTINAAQSGTWTINAAQTGTWTINIGAPLDASGNLKAAIQSSVTLNVNITGSTTLNVNISSITSGVTMNVSITGSVTINVLAESGKMVSVGKTVGNYNTQANTSFSAGVEKTLLSVSGRGKLSFMGFFVEALNTTTDIKGTEIEVYIDGSRKIDVYLSELDYEWNGYNIRSQTTATGTFYRATAVNPVGALTTVKTCTDDAAKWEKVGGFIAIECEYTTSLSVRVYNASYGGYISIGIVYGPYV